MKVLISAVMALVLSAVVMAQEGEKGNIELKTVAEVQKEVTNEKGEKEIKLVPATLVVPGDEVINTTYYTNISDKQADDIFITIPVPEHVRYIDGTAGGENTQVLFSVDGGMTFDVPGKLMVADAEGNKHKAKPEEYTHIKWVLKKSLKAGEKGTVSFKTQIK